MSKRTSVVQSIKGKALLALLPLAPTAFSLGGCGMVGATRESPILIEPHNTAAVTPGPSAAPAGKKLTGDGNLDAQQRILAIVDAQNAALAAREERLAKKADEKTLVKPPAAKETTETVISSKGGDLGNNSGGDLARPAKHGLQIEPRISDAGNALWTVEPAFSSTVLLASDDHGQPASGTAVAAAERWPKLDGTDGGAAVTTKGPADGAGTAGAVKEAVLPAAAAPKTNVIKSGPVAAEAGHPAAVVNPLVPPEKANSIAAKIAPPAEAAPNPIADGATAISAMGAMAAISPPMVVPHVATKANETVGVAPAAAGEPTMDGVIDVLRKRVQARPQQLNYALALALLEQAETGKAGDDPVVSALSQVDQRVVNDLVGAVQAVSGQAAGAAASLDDRTLPIRAAVEKWQGEQDLKLPRLVLASRVDSFGVFSQVEPKFENGKRTTVIIYCEVANFGSKKTDDGWYQTKLAQQDTLMTDDGLLVWRPNPEEVEDKSMNQRKDFYLVKKLVIPETLAIGKYTLKMSVTDKMTGKISQVTMPIEVTGK